ncbi:MAG: hypothetical protein KJO07_03940 [Deltaproteobacteria bacterium]|nr:hypothetical protein [Deltaproteobacteria bacterium]
MSTSTKDKITVKVRRSDYNLEVPMVGVDYERRDMFVRAAAAWIGASEDELRERKSLAAGADLVDSLDKLANEAGDHGLYAVARHARLAGEQLRELIRTNGTGDSTALLASLAELRRRLASTT